MSLSSTLPFTYTSLVSPRVITKVAEDPSTRMELTASPFPHRARAQFHQSATLYRCNRAAPQAASNWRDHAPLELLTARFSPSRQSFELWRHSAYSRLARSFSAHLRGQRWIRRLPWPCLARGRARVSATVRRDPRHPLWSARNRLRHS